MCVFVQSGSHVCLFVITDERSVHVQFTVCAGDAAGLCGVLSEPEGSSSGFR